MINFEGTLVDRGLTAISRDGARVLLIGGPPFPEKILMWWNFVARTQEEIAHASAPRYAGTRTARPAIRPAFSFA